VGCLAKSKTNVVKKELPFLRPKKKTNHITKKETKMSSHKATSPEKYLAKINPGIKRIEIMKGGEGI